MGRQPMHSRFCEWTLGDAVAALLTGRLVTLAVAALAALIAPAALALGLGEITVTSRLGEPLRAFVPVSGIQGADGACIGLASGNSGADEPPWLSQAALRLERRKTGARIHITTGHAVYDPILMVRLAAGCGTEIARDYTLLLSPPDTGEIPVVRMSPTYETEPPGEEPDMVRTQETAGTAVRKPHRGGAAKHKLSRPTRAAEPVDGRSVDQGVGQEGAKRRATSDLGTSASRESSSAERAWQRQEAKLLAALENQVAAERALAERIQHLEEALAALRQQVQAAGELTASPVCASVPLAAQGPAES
ncbi:MAG: hypothetical protein WBP72_06200, partial [Rhodocyclaceae bacterium]